MRVFGAGDENEGDGERGAERGGDGEEVEGEEGEEPEQA